MGVLRVNKAAKRRVLAAHAGCALPKGRRTRRRRTRSVCAHALLAVAAGFPCVLRVTVIRHVPLAPLLALAALAVISEHCCIGNVSQGVIVVGHADFSREALVASAAGLLCRFALAIICDLVFAPRLTTTVRHADVESFALSLQAAHGGRVSGIGSLPICRSKADCPLIITHPPEADVERNRHRGGSRYIRYRW